MSVRTITCIGIFLMVLPAALQAGEQTFGNWTVTITPNGHSRQTVQQAAHLIQPRAKTLVKQAVQTRPLEADFDSPPPFDAPPSFDAPRQEETPRKQKPEENNPLPAAPEPASDYPAPLPSQDFIPSPDAPANPEDAPPREETPLIIPDVLVPPAPEPSAGHGEIVPCAPTSTADLVKLYRSVYDAIPFSRAEYDANPTYRHDATMEFLFGQLRPTVIQRGTMRVNVQLPPVAVEPIPYNRYGMNSGYFPFYAGGLRVHRSW